MADGTGSVLQPRPHDIDLGRGLAAGWTAAEAAAVEAWHYRCAERTFASRVTSEPWGRLVLTDGIGDPEWNHVSVLRWGADEVVERLRQAASALAGADRQAVVVTAPWSKPADLDRRFAELGWVPCYKHQWSFFDLARAPAVHPVAGYEYVHVGSAEEMEQYVAVFVAVYDEDGRLDPGYAPALRRSWTEPGVRHHLIRHQGEPVAIGTVLIEDERAQIFNMVVRDGHRRQGLAEWLLNARLRQAREEGALRLTALSDNSRIDRWLEARGFVPGWFTVGYALAGEARAS